MKKNYRIAVFCGSGTGNDPVYSNTCIELAGVMAENNIGLVYGGGNIGLMGVLADEMLKQGSEVIGVIPQKLVDIEVAHKGLNQLHIVNTMHERKALMADLSDGFIALPGGIGTFEEFFEVFTWRQLGYHHKPVGIINVAGYYDLLCNFLDACVEKRFVNKIFYQSLIIKTNPGDMLDEIMRNWKQPADKRQQGHIH